MANDDVTSITRNGGHRHSGLSLVRPRPAKLRDALRLANEALEQLNEAIGETGNDDLQQQLEDARSDLKSAIAYMRAVPEAGA